MSKKLTITIRGCEAWSAGERAADFSTISSCADGCQVMAADEDRKKSEAAELGGEFDRRYRR
jgi:hypothetical protein